MRINELVREAFEYSKSNGFYDNGFNFGEKIALIHSELSEALEEWRKGSGPVHIRYENDDYVKGKPDGLPIEIADVFIRLFDLCGYFQNEYESFDIEDAIRLKMNYNKTRPYRHGKKF